MLHKISNMYIEKLNTGIFQYSICFDDKHLKSKPKFIRKSQNDDFNEDFIIFLNDLNEVPSHKRGNKIVKFNLKPSIHLMYAWRFAYSEARKNCWEEAARDRVRFQNKIDKLSKVITPVLIKNQIKTNENKERKQ